VSQDGVELARYDEAGEAREAARRLLSAGLTPAVRREGAVHVLSVPPAHAAAAAELLAVDPPSGVDGGDAAPVYVASGDWSVPHDAHHEDIPPDAAGGEDDLDDLVVDERGFVVVALADGPDEARTLAARLLEAGIPSEACSAFATGHANPMATVGDPQAVQVLEVDADRALGVLGAEQLPRRLAHPGEPAVTSPAVDAAPEATPEQGAPRPEAQLRRRTEVEEVRPYLGGRLNLTRRQVRTMIALYLAALVLIPLAFFLATQWILTPDIERPELPEVPVDAVVPLPEIEGWFTAAAPGRP
jgi:hypothetical protein